jgi:hypothetical protein
MAAQSSEIPKGFNLNSPGCKPATENDKTYNNPNGVEQSSFTDNNFANPLGLCFTSALSSLGCTNGYSNSSPSGLCAYIFVAKRSSDSILFNPKNTTQKT